MANQPAGCEWLRQYLDLTYYRLSHRSFIGTKNKIEVTFDGSIEETYGPKYTPTDSVPAHIEFALKYDDLSLDFLSTVFHLSDEHEMTSFISARPNGRYSRKMGFLYEWLTGKKLHLKFESGGNYIDLLDSKQYITGKTKRNSRWRINDNLIGGPEFCPIVRRTNALEKWLDIDLKAQILQLKEKYTLEIFTRATQ